MDIVLLSSIFAVIAAIYFYLTKRYSYWRDQGIPCPKGIFPGFGHMWPMISMRMNISDFIQHIYNSQPNCSMVGFYNKMTPSLVVRDPELVKTVMQTNFSNFSDNMFLLDPHLDPLLSLNPFFSNGEMWNASRKRLARAFSSMRMKLLFGCIEQVCDEFEDYLDRCLNSGVSEYELKDLFSKYTGEFVANGAFGVKGFCFKHDKAQSQTSFQTIGNLIFDSSLLNRIMVNLTFLLPKLTKIFRISFLPKEVDRFIRSTVKEILRHRQQENPKRNDFFQLMMDLDKNEDGVYDERALAADTLSFFLDGYETTSITLSFIGYQLARHPQVLQKLREEVESVLAKHDGRMTYESLEKMTYMDQVISESQRLYTVLAVMPKFCTKEIELKGSDGLCCRLQPGMMVIIPAHAIHMDSKYWLDVETFDPDRFAADKKTEIDKYAFLPFGKGPRMCVGMRMGILQMKVFLATFVRRYTLELSPKTQLPLKMLPGTVMTTPASGLWATIKRL
ncbi:probable cytochrome P450 6a13 [Pseudomyrmex gracilis]|uniref:probable cytochrome P450 6a13 n=1 Tax=Pseudomyrmex gracilis TaxID=219809 RepID=UPI0009957B50|nr:probable cytochrome P450 6a13 [Pseudomyrmex gracilis]